MNLKAFYFDGKSSRRHTVRLEVEEGVLRVYAPEQTYHVPLRELRISEPQGRAPRTLGLADGAYCEMEQGMPLQALLDELGHRESVVARIQNRWRWSFLSLVAVILTLTAAYLWGLPLGAKIIAPQIPVSAMREISATVLEELDGYLLRATRLSEERQQKIRLGFQRMVELDPELRPYGGPQLLFRSSGIGPNAFALPGGQVILLDELAKLNTDEEILAVLAHELGHLNKRHGIRQLIQSSVVAAITTAYLGDISYAASATTALVLESGYSRDMEREADAYAAEMLARQGKSPALLANALEKMEGFYRDQEKSKDKARKNKKDEQDFDWFSSHPDTEERIQWLKTFQNAR
jgi:Zn-dependent protease with chaperone function